jgi:hypothetical protein
MFKFLDQKMQRKMQLVRGSSQRNTHNPNSLRDEASKYFRA